MIRYLSALMLIGLFFMAGCANTTGDPNSGGLFGWSEKKAQDRQVAAEGELDGERYKQIAGLEEQDRLKKEVDAKAKTKAALEKNIKAMERDLAALDRKISTAKSSEATQQNTVSDLKNRKNKLQSDLNTLQKNSIPDEDEAAEIARLKKEVDQLTKEALTLSEL